MAFSHWQIIATLTHLGEVNGQARWSYTFGGLMGVGDPADLPLPPDSLLFPPAPAADPADRWDYQGLTNVRPERPDLSEMSDIHKALLDILRPQWDAMKDDWSQTAPKYPVLCVPSAQGDYEVEISDDTLPTWTSVLASLALKGRPIAHALSLAAWFDVDPAADIFATPILPRFEGFEPPALQGRNNSPQTGEVTYRYQARPAAGTVPLLLRLRVSTLSSAAFGPAESSRSPETGVGRDWRLNLRPLLGRELDAWRLAGSASSAQEMLELAFDRLSLGRFPQTTAVPGPPTVFEIMLRLIVPPAGHAALAAWVRASGALRPPAVLTPWRAALLQELDRGDKQGARRSLAALYRAGSPNFPALLSEVAHSDRELVLALWEWDFMASTSKGERDGLRALIPGAPKDEAILPALREKLGERSPVELYDAAMAEIVWPEVTRALDPRLSAPGLSPVAHAEQEDGVVLSTAVLAAFKTLAGQKGAGRGGLHPASGLQAPAAADAATVARIRGASKSSPTAPLTVSAPTLAPQPLMVPIPFYDAAEGQDLQGVSVFARREDTIGGQPTGHIGWECLTLGQTQIVEVSAKGAVNVRPKSLVAHMPVSIPFSTSDGIRQDVLRYQGRPVGIGDFAETGDDEQKKGRTVLHVAPLADAWAGWHGALALRYGPDTSYRFLFAPMHLSGALPFSLCQPDGQLLHSEVFKPSFEPIARSYLRQVPVGQVRFRLADDPPTTPLSLETGSFPLPGRERFAWPVIPAGVRPLAEDRAANQANDLASSVTQDAGGNPIAKSDGDAIEAAGRTEVVLLDQDSTSSCRFRLSPPATEVENWSRWSEPLIPAGYQGEPGNAFDRTADTIEAVRRLCRRLARLGREDVNQFLAGLLNDPAVAAVELSLLPLFPEEKPDPLSDPWRFFVPDQKLAQAGSTPAALIGQVRPLVSAGQSASAAESAPPLEVILKWKETATLGQVLSPAGKLELSFPPGEVWQLTLTPLVRQAERFATGILGAQPSDLVPVSQAARILQIETAPALSRPGGAGTLLPDGEALWNALTLVPASSSANSERLRASFSPDKIDKKHWPWLGWVRIELQWWRWNGLPQRGGLLATAATPSSAASGTAEDDLYHAALAEGEIAGYYQRSEMDAEIFEVPLNLAGPIPRSKPVEIYSARGDLPAAPGYVRAKITAFSRYARPLQPGEPARGLRRFQDVAVVSNHQWMWQTAGADHVISGEAQPYNPWRRAIVPGRLTPQTRLLPPRVKMVLPVMIPEGAGLRPGIVVVTRDVLPSPFHQLRAEMDVALLDQSIATDGKTQGVLRSLEFGADPATAATGPDPTRPDPGKPDPARPDPQSWQASIEAGEPFGLTFEPAAGNPLFPHAGFHFKFPEIKGADGKLVDFTAMTAHDFFAKLRFHWEIVPPRVMLDTPAEWLVGPATLPWQVRFLSAFDAVRTPELDALGRVQSDSQGRAKLRPVPIGSLHFKLDLGQLAFFGTEGKSLPISPPRFSDQEKLKGLRPVLLFVGWRRVPNFFSAALSRRAECLYVLVDEVWRCAIPGEAGEITEGQLLMCHFRADAVVAPEEIWKRFFGDATEQELTGVPTTEPDGMIVRCSETILRVEQPTPALR
jgi:hypothetical protein